MTPKLITLRKISTGGILHATGTSASAVINRMNLDPADWEEVSPDKESENTNIGED